MYNAIGDDLFERAIEMPEYYPISAEKEIIEQQGNSLIASFNLENLTEAIDVIDLGAGDGQKSILLLKQLMNEKKHFDIYLLIYLGTRLMLWPDVLGKNCP